jgi:hypothetical protein
VAALLYKDSDDDLILVEAGSARIRAKGVWSNLEGPLTLGEIESSWTPVLDDKLVSKAVKEANSASTSKSADSAAA